MLILRAADQADQAGQAHGKKGARGDASLPLEILSRFPHAGLKLTFASVNAAPIQPDLMRFIGSIQTLELGGVTSLELAIDQRPSPHSLAFLLTTWLSSQQSSPRFSAYG